MKIAKTPKPPYYAVIFSNELTEDTAGYEQMAQRMVELAQQQAGFLGFESARDGIGISVSYWQDLDSISAWKVQLDHQQAQALGKSRWYADYKTRIALVERDYGLGGEV